jgi:hypothetical protein
MAELKLIWPKMAELIVFFNKNGRINAFNAEKWPD